MLTAPNPITSRSAKSAPATSRVAVLSGTIPGEPGVGGVILKDLVQLVQPGSLRCVPLPTAHALSLGWMERCPQPSTPFVRRYETGWRPVRGLIGESLGWAAGRLLSRRHCKRLVQEICSSLAAENIRRVWAVLDCPTAIEIADRISSQLQVPLSVMVWDAPELLADQLRLDRWSAKRLLARFRQVVQTADRVGVICEQMETAYRQRFGANHYVIMRHGIDEALWHRARNAGSGSRLVIGFAGSITAQQPFQQLIRLLDSNGWRIGGRSVTLRLIGSRYTVDSRAPQHIEYFGWRSNAETVELLSGCDLLYLPQPFEPHLRDLAELSFPTKLSTYLAAGRPVLLHTPEYGSIVPLFMRFRFGRWSSSLDPEALHTALCELAQSEGVAEASAIEAARAAEFSQSVFLSRFYELTRP